MYDFLRFHPGNCWNEEFFSLLGFDGFIVMQEKTEHEQDSEERNVYTGIAIISTDVKELRKKLKDIKGEVIVGVYSDRISVYREAVMRKKVDIILDGPERELDYTVIKLAAEKDVAIEFSLSKFLRTSGFRRMKLFERLGEEIAVAMKFDTPCIISSAATRIEEMRTRKQMETFFSFFGLDIKKALQHAERIVRRYYDPNYIMNGFEIES